MRPAGSGPRGLPSASAEISGNLADGYLPARRIARYTRPRGSSARFHAPHCLKYRRARTLLGERLERVEDVGKLVDALLVRSQVARIERSLRLVVEALGLGNQPCSIRRQLAR